MLSFLVTAAIFAFGTAAVSASSMNLFSRTTCTDDDYIENISVTSGCHTFPVANVKAIDVRTLSGSCTGK
jgi:hypothetical protein